MEEDQYEQLVDATRLLAAFLRGRPFTETVSELEQGMVDALSEELEDSNASAKVTADLLAASGVLRREFGRLNDVIHAVGILLVLPHLLDSGERIVNRPSLAAGNDQSRPFDVETDARIAEFKFSVWKDGRDVARKKALCKDLVALAADRSGRAHCLYVLGQAPLDFVSRSGSKLETMLDTRRARSRYENAFGPLGATTVSEFASGAAAHVEIVDLAQRLPEVLTPFLSTGAQDE